MLYFWWRVLICLKNINFDKAMEYANIDNLLLKRRDNGMHLSDFQIDILKRNGFDYLKYNNIKEMLFDIEEYLYDEYDDELDLVSSQIYEYIYYKDMNK